MNNANRFKAIAYALALLVFGGVIGAMIKSATTVASQPLRLGRVDEIMTVIRDHLNAKLDLTPEQKARIEPMIKKAAEEMEASHLQCLQRVNKAADDLHAQVKAQLAPEQQAKMVELEKERQDRMLQKYNYQAGTNAGQR